MEIRTGDILFLDTNILLTATDTSRKNHRKAHQLFNAALQKGVHLCFSGQIIREYLSVATRDAEGNGLGMMTADALKNIREFRGRMTFLEETEDVAEELIRLAGTCSLKGKRIHDANLAAVMKAHAVTKLVTENVADFEVFPGIEAADLAEADKQLPGE